MSERARILGLIAAEWEYWAASDIDPTRFDDPGGRLMRMSAMIGVGALSNVAAAALENVSVDDYRVRVKARGKIDGDFFLDE